MAHSAVASGLTGNTNEAWKEAATVVQSNRWRISHGRGAQSLHGDSIDHESDLETPGDSGSLS
jgi:hypothetical protein